MLLTINSTLIGTKINQPTILPGFILDPACPKPIVREFLGGLFGADGHTCVLSMHRGKRDILTSISYSKCKHVELLDNLTDTFENIKLLFGRFDITNVTVQSFKETTYSKSHTDKPKTLQLTLHLGIDELIPFSEKIGFRYCCHKTQRLEAGVSYKRLKNEVVRQRNWIINRIDELTDFKKTKEEKAIETIPVDIKVVRFDKLFFETPPSDLNKLKLTFKSHHFVMAVLLLNSKPNTLEVFAFINEL